ncbi:CU044_2847 family protein [Streptomyces acidiscabies]|uniref:CU044_2847 family protein n=1 Tax=Streptomyces acidiscabies TaxID=42234 RepID=UPI0035A2497F
MSQETERAGQDVTRVARVALPDGTPVWARISGPGELRAPSAPPGQLSYSDTGFTERVEAGVESLHSLITGVAHSLAGPLRAVRPDEASIEFGIELTAKAGKVVGLLADGEAKAAITVTLTWGAGGPPDRTTPAAPPGTRPGDDAPPTPPGTPRPAPGDTTSPTNGSPGDAPHARAGGAAAGAVGGELGEQAGGMRQERTGGAPCASAGAGGVSFASVRGALSAPVGSRSAVSGERVPAGGVPCASVRDLASEWPLGAYSVPATGGAASASVLSERPVGRVRGATVLELVRGGRVRGAVARVAPGLPPEPCGAARAVPALFGLPGADVTRTPVFPGAARHVAGVPSEPLSPAPPTSLPAPAAPPSPQAAARSPRPHDAPVLPLSPPESVASGGASGHGGGGGRRGRGWL